MAISGISSNAYQAYAPLTQGGPRARDAGTDADAGAAQDASVQAGLPPGQRVQAGADSQSARNSTENKGQEGAAKQTGAAPGEDKAKSAEEKKAAQNGRKSDGSAFSRDELAQLSKLQARDLEVRQHEMAHLAAAGGLATSGASFTYQKGPDGVNYAIGGEVSIDTSGGGTPQETIQRARTIQAAALAPASPSGPDRAVAAAAQQMELQARAELVRESVSGGKESEAAPASEDNAAPAAKEAQAKDPAQLARDVAQALAESQPQTEAGKSGVSTAPAAPEPGSAVSAASAKTSRTQAVNAGESRRPVEIPTVRPTQLERAYGHLQQRQPNLRAIA